MSNAVNSKDQEAYDKFFANGGKVTVCEAFATTENLVINPWKKSGKGRPKAKGKK
jgi:hypothetical protein